MHMYPSLAQARLHAMVLTLLLVWNVGVGIVGRAHATPTYIQWTLSPEGGATFTK